MFNQRSNKKELLDANNIPREDLYQNLRELNAINSLLGGHAVTIKGLEQFRFEPGKTYRILDIGSGGGDNLRIIADWARKRKLHFELTGVDLKKDCIDYAREHCKNYPEIKFIQSDYRDIIKQEHEFDLILACLFCHHLSDDEIKELLSWCSRQAKLGFIINDLHRHPLAYYSIALLTRLFSKSYLVKNDAKLSVLRGFSRKELQAYLVNMSLPKGDKIQLSWAWAFRWLLLAKNQDCLSGH